MQILKRDTLPLGGFAGLTEHRLVTDSRLFKGRKSSQTFEGLGQFVYLADAKFNPHGQTGMHPHLEIDVITIMLEGEIEHQGSLEHGKGLKAGEVQVQRAGGEGFAHNEVNPHNEKNRLLQIWALPEIKGTPAAYKHYAIKEHGLTRIYGGPKSQSVYFDSSTSMDMGILNAHQITFFKEESMIYIISGTAEISSKSLIEKVDEGTLIKGIDLKLTSLSDLQFIVIKTIPSYIS